MPTTKLDLLHSRRMIWILAFSLACCTERQKNADNVNEGDSPQRTGLDSVATKKNSQGTSQLNHQTTAYQAAARKIQEQPGLSFSEIKELPVREYHELGAAERKALESLCRTVAASHQFEVNERVQFVVDRLPTAELPYFLDDLVLDANSQELEQMEAALRSKDFPMGTARTELWREIATRWYYLGKSKDWLTAWAETLDLPEEKQAVHGTIRFHFGAQ